MEKTQLSRLRRLFNQANRHPLLRRIAVSAVLEMTKTPIRRKCMDKNAPAM
jgi:hypothetical protein